jgi:DNA-binding CsgD family transcriptional regulator
MSRPNRPSNDVPVLCERRRGLPRERTVLLTDGSAVLVKGRLEALAAAFLADTRPGLLFEYGRLVLANDAARRLLGSTAASEGFLEALKVLVGNGVMDSGLLLRTGSEVYAPVLHPASGPGGNPIRACFLVKAGEATTAYACLSGRELDVLRLLVKGLTNRQIAEQLDTSVESVRKHVSRALKKTGAKTRAGLVGQALGR